MKTVLVTAIGSATVDAVLSSLKGNVNLIGCDIYPRHYLTGVDSFNKFYNVPLAIDVKAYTKAIFDICTQNNVDIVIPLTDVECDALSPSKAYFKQNNIILACLDEELQSLCRNKLKLSKCLADVCNTIPSYIYGDDIKEDYPLILKPISGRSSQHQYIANNEKELASFARLRDDFIIQPFIKGSIYTVDLARDSKGNVLSLVRQELLRTVNGLGIAVETFKNHPLNKTTKNIANKLGIVGVVNMEFIENDGNYYFLEINPRFSGGLEFSQMAGYNFVKAMIDCHIGKEIELNLDIKELNIVQSYVKTITKQN